MLEEACREVLLDHPVLRIEVAAVLGDAVPILLREATDAELFVIGARPVKEQAMQAAQEVKENLQQPAQDAVDHLRQTAADAASEVTDEGRT